jgi:hypothetical protein
MLPETQSNNLLKSLQKMNHEECVVDNRAIAEAEELVEETVVVVEVNPAAELEVASPTVDSIDQALTLKNELKI